MRSQTNLTAFDPYPASVLSTVPSATINNLTVPVSRSYTRRLTQEERETAFLKLECEPLPANLVDSEIHFRMARAMRFLAFHRGMSLSAVRDFAHYLEGLYVREGIPRSHDADRGWQLLAQLDLTDGVGVEVWLSAEPEIPGGPRRLMRIGQRLLEVVVGR